MNALIAATLIFLTFGCGGKKAAATDTTPAPAAGDDGVGECVRTCLEDATPDGAEPGSVEALEDACREQCGGLEPGPEARDGYDDGTGTGAD